MTIETFILFEMLNCNFSAWTSSPLGERNNPIKYFAQKCLIRKFPGKSWILFGFVESKFEYDQRILLFSIAYQILLIDMNKNDENQLMWKVRWFIFAIRQLCYRLSLENFPFHK